MLRPRTILLLLALPLFAHEPALLQIHIIEGDGAVYTLGSRATRGVTVQVTDETGKPVDTAAVSFRLPDDGPGGAFSNGSKTEIVTTQSDGRAGVWGMQWNRSAGALDLHITAAKGSARAGIVCPLYLRAGAAPEISSGGSHRKWLWIALAAAGAAGAAGVAFKGGGSTSTSAAPAAVNTVLIGTPTISLGHTSP
jgi:hypothetical protein